MKSVFVLFAVRYMFEMICESLRAGLFLLFRSFACFGKGFLGLGNICSNTPADGFTAPSSETASWVTWPANDFLDLVKHS